MDYLTRPCDNKTCGFCLEIIDVNQNGVICTVPTRHLRKLKPQTTNKFRIQWDLAKKTMSFHETCWDNIVGDETLSRPEKTTIKTILETVEKFHSVHDIQQKAKEVVRLLMNARKVVSFTGAGISVSAGLNTYRGADGIDTIAALGDSEITNPDDLGEDVDYAALKPTFTHKALVKMHTLVKMDYCATQNCDNLHQKAGFPRDCMSDLHGNVFVEYCEECFHEYTRDEPVDLDSTDASHQPWFVKCPQCGWGHYTGRRCSQRGCRGKLRDTIVNFSDFLHETVCGGEKKAIAAFRKADVCFCLGSSLTIYPATDLPQMVKHMVIVNLQETDLDNMASIRVYGTSDMFFALLLPELEKALNATSGGVTGDEQATVAPPTKRRKKMPTAVIDLANNDD